MIIFDNYHIDNYRDNPQEIFINVFYDKKTNQPAIILRKKIPISDVNRFKNILKLAYREKPLYCILKKQNNLKFLSNLIEKKIIKETKNEFNKIDYEFII